MKSGTPISQTVAPLMFKLLPIQILLALISSVNSIISSLFAGNMIGPEASVLSESFPPYYYQHRTAVSQPFLPL